MAKNGLQVIHAGFGRKQKLGQWKIAIVLEPTPLTARTGPGHMPTFDSEISPCQIAGGTNQVC